MRDRVLFPETGFTIGDAVDYYASVAKWMLPHLRGRPVSFKRYPDTVDGESFWEKDAPSFTPKWVKRFAVERRGGGDAIEYVVVDNMRTLKWIAGVGGIEIHPFLHRVPDIDIATHVVFDLDPGEGADLADCCEVALLLRDALAAIDADAYAKVSGSKGLQVYVPLAKGVTHEASESFARLVAEEVARAHPKLAVAKMAKSLRRKKVFIDWSQNADYKTTVAVYSLRAKGDRPFVSMPVTWKEVERAGDLEFSPQAAIKRLQKRGDLFAPILRRGGLRPPELRGLKRAAPTKKGRTQSGRRTFLLLKDELWLAHEGTFSRWILRPDREGGRRLIAMPAGQFAIDADDVRGPIVERGTYEVIEGSVARKQLVLSFDGKTLGGTWTLRKGPRTSWMLAPVADHRPR